MWEKTFILAELAAGILAGGAENITEYEFKQPKDLTKWLTVENKPVPEDQKFLKMKYYTLVDDKDGSAFLWVKGYFGLFSKLSKPILVDGQTVSIEVTVTMRKKNVNEAVLAAFALTSREKADGGTGWAFAKARDSGFGLSGYQYSIQTSNVLYWRKDGAMFKCTPSRKPFNFLNAETIREEKCFTWKLVFRFNEQELLFYRNSDTTPFLIQHGVDLNGMFLNGIWVAGHGFEYKHITIRHTTR